MADQVFKKDTDSTWGSNYRDDFYGESEITVTITLHEYRKLLVDSAKHAEEIRRKDEEMSMARSERDAAKKQLQALLDRLGDDDGESE